MWNCNEIAISFDFRNIVNCIQIVDYKAAFIMYATGGGGGAEDSF